MYKCLNCKEKFETPVKEKEIHYECNENPWEIIYVCPFCGEEDFYEK